MGDVLMLVGVRVWVWERSQMCEFAYAFIWIKTITILGRFRIKYIDEIAIIHKQNQPIHTQTWTHTFLLTS